MSPGSTIQPPTHITVVTAPGCHYCADAHQTLTQLAADGAAVEVEVVEAISAAGLALLATHRPAMNPLVLVDGAYFSAGRLPRRKLEALLTKKATSTEEMAALRG